MAKATPINFALAYMGLLKNKRGGRITPKFLKAQKANGARISAWRKEKARQDLIAAVTKEAPPKIKTAPAQPRISARALAQRARMASDPEFKKGVLERAAKARAARWHPAVAPKTPKATIRPAKSLTNGAGQKVRGKSSKKRDMIEKFARDNQELNANQIATELDVSPSYAYKVLHGY